MSLRGLQVSKPSAILQQLRYAVTGKTCFMQQIRFTTLTMALLFGLQGGAQETTDFSGVWKMDPSRSASAAHAVPVGADTLIIKHNAAELSIETLRAQKHKPTICR